MSPLSEASGGMIERAYVRPAGAGRGCEVSIVLDPWIVRARAEQQRLLDLSTAAAAESQRVVAAITGCIERANQTLAESEATVRWSILS